MEEPDFDEYFALHRKGAYREAYAVLREILDKHPQWSRVGDLYVWAADLELVVNDDARKARELLDKARTLGCQNMEYYYRAHGHVLWRIGEHDRGIQELEKSVALNPSVTNLGTLGQVFSDEGDKRAEGIWQRVLEQDPENCLAHVYLGVSAAKSGDRARALLMVKRAERLTPSVHDRHEIARLYFELGEFQSAIGAYLEADRLGDSPKGPIYAAVAACDFSIGENNTGRKYLDWAVRHNPEHEYVKKTLQTWKEWAAQDK